MGRLVRLHPVCKTPLSRISQLGAMKEKAGPVFFTFRFTLKTHPPHVVMDFGFTWTLTGAVRVQLPVDVAEFPESSGEVCGPALPQLTSLTIPLLLIPILGAPELMTTVPGFVTLPLLL